MANNNRTTSSASLKAAHTTTRASTPAPRPTPDMSNPAFMDLLIDRMVERGMLPTSTPSSDVVPARKRKSATGEKIPDAHYEKADTQRKKDEAIALVKRKKCIYPAEFVEEVKQADGRRQTPRPARRILNILVEEGELVIRKGVKLPMLTKQGFSKRPVDLYARTEADIDNYLRTMFGS